MLWSDEMWLHVPISHVWWDEYFYLHNSLDSDERLDRKHGNEWIMKKRNSNEHSVYRVHSPILRPRIDVRCMKESYQSIRKLLFDDCPICVIQSLDGIYVYWRQHRRMIRSGWNHQKSSRHEDLVSMTSSQGPGRNMNRYLEKPKLAVKSVFECVVRSRRPAWRLICMLFGIELLISIPIMDLEMGGSAPWPMCF